MKNKVLILIMSLLGISVSQAAEIRYSGGDISLYPTYQELDSKYKDQEGNSIDLLPYLHEIGMNAMRVRLFVDPEKFAANHPEEYDSNACQSLPYILPLCKDIIDNGFELMLDFHYSDTWADPVAQWIPEAWKGLSDEELEQAVYDYTRNTLETLKEEGIVPKFIQPGNEISYGMLWAEYGGNASSNKVFVGQREKQWQRFAGFLKSATRACREVCQDSEIIIHTERVSQIDVLTGFYSKMEELDIDYDIIGLSYYPYFHGNMSQLDSALTSVETRFPDKPIMIVETGFPYAWEVPGTTEKVDYAYTLAGQDEYAHELVDTLLDHPNVNGLFWWWLEYNAYGTNLSGWYNAPLFDSRTGKATPALKTIASYATYDAGIEGILDEGTFRHDVWYDLQGRKIQKPNQSGIYILNGEKVLVK